LQHERQRALGSVGTHVENGVELVGRKVNTNERGEPLDARGGVLDHFVVVEQEDVGVVPERPPAAHVVVPAA